MGWLRSGTWLKVAPFSDDLPGAVSDLNSHVYGNFDPNVFLEQSIFEALSQHLTVM